MLTTYQRFIHLIDHHESFNFLFKSTRLPSSLCSFPDFQGLWLERHLTKAPCCGTWWASCSSHLVFSIAHFKPCSARFNSDFYSEWTKERIELLCCLAYPCIISKMITLAEGSSITETQVFTFSYERHLETWRGMFFVLFFWGFFAVQVFFLCTSLHCFFGLSTRAV